MTKPLAIPARLDVTRVLGGDPGARGGWAAIDLAEPGYVASGVACSAIERQTAIASYVTGSTLVVLESWTAGGEWGVAQMLGLGSQRGRWLEALELAGVPESSIVGVYPQTWRTTLAPLARRTGEEAKRSALLVAKAIAKRPLASTDEAEAICIAKWAAEVVRVQRGVIGRAAAAASRSSRRSAKSVTLNGER